MNLPTHLSQAFSQIQLEFDQRYEAVCNPEYTSESIHQLRVNIKKYKAFIHLMSKLNPDFLYKVAVKCLDRLHKDMGKLRDLQITETLVDDIEKKLQLPSSDLEKLKLNKLKYWKLFSEKNNNRPSEPFQQIAQKVDKQLEQLTPEHLPEQLRNYFFELLSVIDKQLIKKKIPYHEVRKKMKMLYYNLSLLNDYPGEIKMHGEIISGLKKILVLLGEWQDYVVQNKIIKYSKELSPKVIKKIKFDQEKNFLELQNALKEFEYLKKQIVNEIDKFTTLLEKSTSLAQRSLSKK